VTRLGFISPHGYEIASFAGAKHDDFRVFLQDIAHGLAVVRFLRDQTLRIGCHCQADEFAVALMKMYFVEFDSDLAGQLGETVQSNPIIPEEIVQPSAALRLGSEFSFVFSYHLVFFIQRQKSVLFKVLNQTGVIWRWRNVAHAIADHDDLGVNRKVQFGQDYLPFLLAAIARALDSW
jgi:hypothetical protein